MHYNIEVLNDMDITSVKELYKLRMILEGHSIMTKIPMKINYAELGRTWNVDQRTAKKYFLTEPNQEKSKEKKQTRNSKISHLHNTMVYLLSKENYEQTRQFFAYKRVLYQYLCDNHGLDCSQSGFRAYIKRHPELNNYFRKTKANHEPILRFETKPGEQAQLDWKEDVRFYTSDGKKYSLQILVVLLSASRYRTYHVCLSKLQSELFACLTDAFETFGGVPRIVVTDNMKTVMDQSRTAYKKGKINTKFVQFASDFGFEVQPCIAGRPQTKAKVEAPMKIIDEIMAYNGKLTLEELYSFVKKLNNRVNTQFNQGTRGIPVLDFEHEKNLLRQLPQKTIRDYYRITSNTVKVNPSSMVSYKSCQYSVPIEFIGKQVVLQIYDNKIHVFYKRELVCSHDITGKPLNYRENDYQKLIETNFPYKQTQDQLTYTKQNLAMIDEVYQNGNK